MAREARRVSGEWVEYVPDIENNRDDPDPFRVWISPATAKELSVELNSRLKFTQHDTDETRKLKSENAMREIFRARVKDPVNYSIPNKDTGDRIVPKTSVEYFDAVLVHGDQTEHGGPENIFEAIGNQSKLRAGLWETLRSRSAPTS